MQVTRTHAQVFIKTHQLTQNSKMNLRICISTMFDSNIPLIFFFFFKAVGSFIEMWSQKTFSSKWDASFLYFAFQKCNSGSVALNLFFFFFRSFKLFCSNIVWSLETLVHVAVFTPSPRTQNTSPHAGTEPQSVSSLMDTTALRWTCGVLVVSSLRSWGISVGEGHGVLCTVCSS